MADRFIVATTSDKRWALDKAWDATKDGGSLRDTFRKFEDEAREDARGATKSSASNGHSGERFDPGSNNITDEEWARIWRELIDRYDLTKSFLEYCKTNSLDPVQTENQQQNVPLASGATATEPNDETIYPWMMERLVAITEVQSDYSYLRT